LQNEEKSLFVLPTSLRLDGSDDLASDSDDEKRIRQAENRVLKVLKEKRRFKPYRNPSATATFAPNDRRPPPYPLPHLQAPRTIISVTTVNSTGTGSSNALHLQNLATKVLTSQTNRPVEKYVYHFE
jgi:hypothetical protein